MKNIICTWGCIYFSVSSFAQQYSMLITDSIAKLKSCDSLIVWDRDKKIAFADFQGVPDMKSIGNAGTAYDIVPIYNPDSPLIAHVVCYFIKKKSWIKKQISDSNTIIHEQGHFDIGEIYARKFERKIANMKIQHDSIDWGIYYIKLNILRELDRFQDKYDNETNHSINKTKQIEWNNKIKKMLQ